jgi:DNA-binding response OmpR family regulator
MKGDNRPMSGQDLSAGHNKLTVLVVEDHADALTALAKLLRMDGHTVYTADGYQAALDVAKKQKLDLALLDIALWDGDGCNLLRDLQKLQRLQAIAVTGFTLADEVAHYRDVGFAAVLAKPLGPSQLRFAISHIMSTMQAHARTEDLRGSSQDSAAPPSGNG